MRVLWLLPLLLFGQLVFGQREDEQYYPDQNEEPAGQSSSYDEEKYQDENGEQDQGGNEQQNWNQPENGRQSRYQDDQQQNGHQSGYQGDQQPSRGRSRYEDDEQQDGGQSGYQDDQRNTGRSRYQDDEQQDGGRYRYQNYQQPRGRRGGRPGNSPMDPSAVVHQMQGNNGYRNVQRNPNPMNQNWQDDRSQRALYSQRSRPPPGNFKNQKPVNYDEQLDVRQQVNQRLNDKYCRRDRINCATVTCVRCQPFSKDRCNCCMC
ncbi:hypothetical protein HDE_11827 [Halotydeus destructor]|nr:hypothetical protein HDE_11827 [Halotydeus destructor]